MWYARTVWCVKGVHCAVCAVRVWYVLCRLSHTCMVCCVCVRGVGTVVCGVGMYGVYGV